MGHPSIERLRRVARALDDLADSVVFIGGAIAPLLQDEPPFPMSRPTKDVDAVVSSTSYATIGPLHDRLRVLGFRQTPAAEHMHRWELPTGELNTAPDLFDLVPAGEHPGGTGQKWDHVALRSVVVTDLGGGVLLRHASAPAFMGLKWAAYDDRGTEDPRSSHDLEDLLALVVSRPLIVDEIDASEPELRQYLVDRAAWLTSNSEFQDLLASHLNNAQDPAAAVNKAGRVLGAVARLLA